MYHVAVSGYQVGVAVLSHYNIRDLSEYKFPPENLSLALGIQTRIKAFVVLSILYIGLIVRNRSPNFIKRAKVERNTNPHDSFVKGLIEDDPWK